MKNLPTIIVAGITALVIASLFAWAHPGKVPAAPVPVGSIASPDIPSNYLSWGGRAVWNVRGSCLSATSTIFSIPNPWSATSTLTNFTINGTNGATTTEIVVGTSTAMSIGSGTTNAGTTTMSENIMGLAMVATSSQFFSSMGVLMGSPKGYISPASTTFQNGPAYRTVNMGISLAPSEYVLGFSTSTYFAANTGGNTSGAVAIPASCTYSASFERGF